MIEPPLPANEDSRLAALEAYEILDSHAEAAFDALTRAAALVCDTPIALISLVHRDRQWFKSSVGVDTKQMSRNVSLCAHAICGEGIFEVVDARIDERFADNPLVLGEPHIQFYAGAPLTTANDLHIGTLCVIDRRPRQLTERQRAVLVELSNVVIQLLDGRKAEIEAVARLKEANRLNEAGQAVARFGCFRVESAAHRVEASDGLFSIFGGRRGEPTPTYAQALDRFHPQDRQTLLARGNAARATGIGHAGEYQVVRPDGTTRDVYVWIEPEPRGDGSFSTFGVIQDITERKNAEREAEREQERYSALFDTVADGIVITDPATGRVLEVNEPAARMFGYTKAELMECDIGQLSSGVAPYTLEMAIERQANARPGETRRFEWQNRRKDGALFWSEISARSVQFGEATAVLGLLRDITDRKAADQQLREAKEQAERANRTKSDFLAAMSHEIRTPMNGVLGMNALLLETNLTSQQRKMGETVRHSGEALLLLLDDILDVAKLEAGQVTLKSSVFDLPPLVEKVVELLAPRATQKGISLVARFGADARNAFHGASNRLRQILLNLVANAVKFTEWGGVEVWVGATPGEDGRSRIRFEVRDTGIGVSAEAQTRLFGAFEQADPSIARRYGGTGLGLNISRRLVELMGGEIGLVDRSGGGSVFWFEVNLQNAASMEPGPTRALPIAAGQAQAGHILIAEDNAVNIEVARLTLTAAGYRVEVAHDGAEALAAARRFDFDLILMDVWMPGMDGLAAARAIRTLAGPRGRVPILALTANASGAKRSECLEAGMDDFVAKPFAPNQLREAVARWIDGRAAKAGEESIVEAAPVIDGAVLDELCLVMSAPEFAALVQLFVAREEAQAEMFARWIATPASPEIAEEAHRIVSSAGALGARRVQKIAARLESACQEASAARVSGLVEALARALAEACAELRRQIEAPQPLDRRCAV